MNIVDYFFENTYNSGKEFLVGKEPVTFDYFYRSSLALAKMIKEKYGEGNHIMLLSPNNKFFITCYLAIMKSGNICIPTDPMIEQKNFDFIYGQTKPPVIFIAKEVLRRLPLDNIEHFSQDNLAEIEVPEKVEYSIESFDDSR